MLTSRMSVFVFISVPIASFLFYKLKLKKAPQDKTKIIENEPILHTEKPIYSSLEETPKSSNHPSEKSTVKQVKTRKLKGLFPLKTFIILAVLIGTSSVAGLFYWFGFRPVQVLKSCTEQAQGRKDSHIEGNKPAAYRDYVVNNLHYSEAQIKDLDSKIEAFDKKSKESWMDATILFRDPNGPDLAYLSDLKNNVPQRTVYKTASKEDKNTFYRECLSKGGLKPESLYEVGKPSQDATTTQDNSGIENGINDLKDQQEKNAALQEENNAKLQELQDQQNQQFEEQERENRARNDCSNNGGTYVGGTTCVFY
jgi:hypothetical protein